MSSIEHIMKVASDPKNWKKTHKKSYEVYVCRPLPGAECMNRLEGSHYVTDQNKQFIISGTVGETWVIDVNKLAKTYTFADGTPITPDTLSSRCEPNGQMDWQKMKTRPDANINFALHIPKSVQNFPVQTSWGDTLLANRPGVGHGLGDFLVCADNGYGQPNLNDVWVVNGEVFPTTYDLHAFPNMFPQSVLTATTPTPQQRFMKKNPVKTKVDQLAITIANGLKAKGHRIGKFSNGSIETKSFTVDNGTYGVKLEVNCGGSYVGVMTSASGQWAEAAGWFLEDAGMEESLYRIHVIMSGNRTLSDIKRRAFNLLKDDPDSTFVFGEQTSEIDERCLASNLDPNKVANKLFKIIKQVAPKFKFKDVSLAEIEGNTYAILVEGYNARGNGIIDISYDGSIYGYYLDGDSNETAHTMADINDNNSIKKMIVLFYNEMSKDVDA